MADCEPPKGRERQTKGLANDRGSGFLALKFLEIMLWLLKLNVRAIAALNREETMTYLTLSIEENTPAAYAIEAIAEAEHVSPQEAALKLLASLPVARKSKATPEALAILGAFSSPEDVALMDDVMELVMSERERQSAEPPRV
jgi:hypothetical protein